MSEMVLIAASKKEAQINAWLAESGPGQHTVMKQIMLLGFAAALHELPGVQSRLSDRAKSFLPSGSVSEDFLVEGIEAWGIYFEALTALQTAAGGFGAGALTEEEALAAIDAISLSSQ